MYVYTLILHISIASVFFFYCFHSICFITHSCCFSFTNMFAGDMKLPTLSLIFFLFVSDFTIKFLFHVRNSFWKIPIFVFRLYHKYTNFIIRVCCLIDFFFVLSFPLWLNRKQQTTNDSIQTRFSMETFARVQMTKRYTIYSSLYFDYKAYFTRKCKIQPITH